MKQTALLSLLIILIAGIADAQSFEHIYLKVGAASAHQTWAYSSAKYLVESSTGWGINAGLAIDLSLSPDIGLEVEALYAQKRISIQLYNVGAEKVIEEQMRIHAVSVPILAIINIPTNGVDCFMLLGPRIDILSNAKDVNGRDAIKDANTFEVGGTLGIGVRSIIPRLGLELRYAVNFTNYYSYPPDLTIKNDPGLQLLVTMAL